MATVINPIFYPGGMKPQIIVTAPTGSTVKLDGVTGVEVSGMWTFTTTIGTHTVTASLGTQSKTETVIVDQVGLYQVEIGYIRYVEYMDISAPCLILPDFEFDGASMMLQYKCMPTTNGAGSRFIFSGTKPADNYDSPGFNFYSTSLPHFYWPRPSGSVAYFSYSYLNKSNTWMVKQGSVYRDGTRVLNYTNAVNDFVSKLSFLAGYDGLNPWTGRIWYFRVDDISSGHALANIRPCIVGSEPAFYDDINDCVYYNEGSGAMVPGPDI